VDDLPWLRLPVLYEQRRDPVCEEIYTIYPKVIFWNNWKKFGGGRGERGQAAKPGHLKNSH